MSFKLKALCVFFVVSTITFIPQAFAQVESELGLATSYYQYQEPSLMSIKAVNIGMNYTGTLIFQRDWFVRADLIGVVSGNVHYSSRGTGESDNQKNWYADVRALFGKNFTFEDSVLAPYMGLGDRYLYNDGRGLTSTYHRGYRRESNYYYLPIGVTHKLDLASNTKLVTNIEFDYLLIGKQNTYLSDVNGLLRDFTNTQKSGFGVRLGSMYQINQWSIGPYLIYWCIDGSGLDNVYGVMWEPKNNTLEAGLKVSILF